LPDSLPIKLKAGTLDSELKVLFKEVSDKVYSVAVVGSVHVSGLALLESQGQPLASWKRLDVDLDNADPINRKVEVKRVGLDGLEVFLAVNQQGEFNVMRVADQLAKPAAPEARGGQAIRVVSRGVCPD
jgi:hypothetical protein